jgi:hypothetical protein
MMTTPCFMSCIHAQVAGQQVRAVFTGISINSSFSYLQLVFLRQIELLLKTADILHRTGAGGPASTLPKNPGAHAAAVRVAEGGVLIALKCHPDTAVGRAAAQAA